jgi:hypothetical protein
MHTQDNAKVIQVIEKATLFNYFEKLVDAKTTKITLFSVFPYTAAANLSDQHNFFLLEDLTRLTDLNSGNSKN